MLASEVIVPAAVAQELATGRSQGYHPFDVADYGWMKIRHPMACPTLPTQKAFGPGESSVIWLALETPGSVALLDDGPARRTAAHLGIAFTGTLTCRLAIRMGRIAILYSQPIYFGLVLSINYRSQRTSCNSN